ncbi:MAG TPA: hypothetical protein VG897_06365 [Terriglobales bacterium]|nr:hypothetical protein [Terriglobales bacterium]
MVQKLTKPSPRMLPILFAVLSITLLFGTMAFAGDKSPQTVTGCLQKGTEATGFYIIDANNTHWELYPAENVSLADHVGHTITVTGPIVKRTEAQEKVSQPFEKKEIGAGGHHDLQVSDVKMVSESCSK